MGSRAEVAVVDVAAGVAAGPVEVVGDPAEAEAHDLAAAPDLPGVADRAAAPDLQVGEPGRVVVLDPVAAPGLVVAPDRVVAPDPVLAIVPVRGPVVAEIVHPPSANRAEGGAASATVVVSAVAARRLAARVASVVEAGLAAREVFAGAALVAREVSEVLAAAAISGGPVASVAEAALAPVASAVSAAEAASAAQVASVVSEHQAALAADLRLAADRASPLCRPTDLTLEEEAVSARIWARLALEPWVVRWAAAWRIEWAIAPRPVCQDWATIGLVLVPSVTGETVSTIV
jgi:nicotinate-nucleotide--dimethylbenzimidazole phosphoribosyltransferase